MNAISNEDEILVRQALESKIDPNYVSLSGSTPLSLAAKKGYSKISNILIQAGSNVNLVNDLGDYPITEATIGRHSQLVRLLIQSGASTDVFSKEGYSPLAIALKAKNLEMAKIFINSGSRIDLVNIDGLSALDIAIRENNKKSIEYILDIEKIKKAGLKLQHFIEIVSEGRISSFDYIFSKETLFKNFKQSNIAYSILQTKSDFPRNHMLKELIKQSFYIGDEASEKILLIEAVKQDDFDTVITILSSGFDINISDNLNRTALTYAISKLSVGMVDLLDKKGAKKFYKSSPESEKSTNSCDYLPKKSQTDLYEERKMIKRILRC